MKHCLSNTMNEKENEEAGNVGSENESAGSECETEDRNCENSEAERDGQNYDQGDIGDADQRLITLRRKLNKCQV